MSDRETASGSLADFEQPDGGTDDFPTVRPRVLIGVSRESLPLARAIQVELEIELDTSIWNQGVFAPGQPAAESLEEAVRDFDAAIVVLTADDLAPPRAGVRGTPRDRVLYQLGLLVGALGRGQVFLVRPVETELDLPNELLGLTIGRFRRRADANIQASVAPACSSIRTAVATLFRAKLDGIALDAPETHSRKPIVPRRRRRRSLGSAVSSLPSGYHPIVNISETGALIQTHGPLPVGRNINLDLALETGTRVKVRAAVVRNQLPGWGRAGGVGIAFRDVDDQTLETLRDYIASGPIGD